MPPSNDVSHSDIYHKLGSLEGKVEALILQIGERRDEIRGVFSRLRGVEIRMAWAVGTIACLTFVGPLVLKILAFVGPLALQMLSTSTHQDHRAPIERQR